MSFYASKAQTLELQHQFYKKLGKHRADKYFSIVAEYTLLRMSKDKFSKMCLHLIGKDNMKLHNDLIKSSAKTLRLQFLINNGSSKGSNVENPNGIGIGNGNVLSPSPRKARSSFIRDRKLRDRPSPLGPQGKVNGIACDELTTPQSATELFSNGSRPPVEVFSVEDGEEVEQMMGSPSIQSRSPLKAPLGVPTNMPAARKALRSSFLTSFNLETCRNSYELPDSKPLRTRLEQKLEKEGLGISMDCVNLLNNGLDTYLKRLIKPCIELARSRGGNVHQQQFNDQVVQSSNGMWPERYMQRTLPSVSASLLDFRVAMELNPQLLGEDWPVQLERVCLRTSEE